MSYKMKVVWNRKSSEVFVDNRYSRGHTWMFDGGIDLPASSSVHVVPLPMSVEAAVDPEEAFIAALSSCHMLWFLSIAAGKGYTVESYIDDAEGDLGKDPNGALAMTKVRLNPKTVFVSDLIPTHEQVDELHKQAHKKCFIANSVRSQILITQS